MFKIKTFDVYSIMYAWLGVPALLFILFWFKWYWSLPTAILFSYSSIAFLRKIKTTTKNSYYEIGKSELIIMGLLLVWMVIVGIGGFITQEQYDNSYRNEVLEQLVSKPWPVTAEATKPLPYLCYYFIYWLIPAGIGKLASSTEAAYITLFIYSYIGMAFSVLSVMRLCGRQKILVGVFFFLFGSCDVFNFLIFGKILGWVPSPSHGSHFIGNASVLYMCRYIHNMGISALVIMIILYENRKNPGVLFLLWSFLFLYSPFVSLPIAPLVGYVLLKHLRQAISPANMGAICLAGLTAVFYMGNTSGGSIKTIFQSDLAGEQIILMTLGYLLFNFAVFMPFIWKEIKRDSIFWSLLAFTMVFSVLMPEYGNYDFGWKCTIPISVYFMVIILRRMSQIKWGKGFSKQSSNVVFALLLCLSVFSNYRMYYDMVWEYYMALCKEPPVQLGRARLHAGQLFINSETICYDNFVQDKPTLYSKYFMNKTSE